MRICWMRTPEFSRSLSLLAPNFTGTEGCWAAGSGDIFFLPTFQTQMDLWALSEIVLLSVLGKAPSFPFPLGPLYPLLE